MEINYFVLEQPLVYYCNLSAVIPIFENAYFRKAEARTHTAIELGLLGLLPLALNDIIHVINH